MIRFSFLCSQIVQNKNLRQFRNYCIKFSDIDNIDKCFVNIYKVHLTVILKYSDIS